MIRGVRAFGIVVLPTRPGAEFVRLGVGRYEQRPEAAGFGLPVLCTHCVRMDAGMTPEEASS